MTGQLHIDDIGELVDAGPVSWDGVPLFSAATVAEGLFAVEAFEQIRGQIAFEDEDGEL